MSGLRVYMAGPPSLTEVTAVAGHAALAISGYVVNPNVASLVGTASITLQALVATTEIGGAPIVLSVTVDNITTTSVRVNWSLDQNATGRVEFGTTTAYGYFTTEETSFDYSSHSQTVPSGGGSLVAGTTYHYRVIGENALGQAYASADQTFTTLSDVVPGTYYYAPAPRGGTLDDTAALNTFLASVPSGTSGNPSIVIFSPTATYRLNNATDTRLHLRSKSYVYVYGMAPGSAAGALSESTQRCTIYNTSTGGNLEHSAWGIGNNFGACNNIKVIGFRIVGANTANFQTNDQFYSPKQYSSGFLLYATGGQHTVELAYNIIEYQWGHGIYVRTGVGLVQWDNVNMHHNVIRGVGVMGIAVANGTNIYIDDNQIYDTGLYPVDIEDEASPSYITNFYVRRNLIQDWGWSRTYNGPLAVTSYSFMDMTNVYIQDNTIAGAVHAIYQASTVGQRGIFEFRPGGWSAAGPGWGTNFVISGNVSTVQQNGVQVLVQRVLGLTITDNTFKGDGSAYVLSATNGSTVTLNSGNVIVP